MLLTQRVKGAHAEHEAYKHLAREFVLRTFFRGWGGDPLTRDAAYNVSFDEWEARPSRRPTTAGGGARLARGAAKQGGRRRRNP